MTKISELITKLKEIEEEHGDVPVRILWEVNPYGGQEYEDVEFCVFTTDKDDPQISINPYADGFVVIG